MQLLKPVRTPITRNVGILSMVSNNDIKDSSSAIIEASSDSQTIDTGKFV